MFDSDIIIDAKVVCRHCRQHQRVIWEQVGSGKEGKREVET